MITLLNLIMKSLIQILPIDPIQQYLITNVNAFTFLPFLNWIIPFDIIAVITELWSGAIISYYAFDTVKNIVDKYIIDKLFS